MSLLLREIEVDELLTMAEAIEAVEEAFSLLGQRDAVNCPRRRGAAGDAILNVMWAIAPTLGVMGVKAYSIVRTDVTQGASFTFLLYDLPSGRHAGILEAGVLGQRRTGAASAVATKYMANRDSETLTVFGAGWQAESQVEAVAQVLPCLSRIIVVGRSQERRDRFVEKMQPRLGIPFELSEAEHAVREADVLITATGSSEPLFDGAWLSPGTHVNAIGSNVAEKREIDAETLRLASRVVVDSVEVARLESGDLLRNGFDFGALEELGSIVAGNTLGRRRADEITVFESQGLAIEDLSCAVRVLCRARELGLGMEIPV